MIAPDDDQLERAVLAGAVSALRRQAAAIRLKATAGVVVLDRNPPVIVLASECAHAFKVAKDFDRIADALEAEATS